MIGIVLDCILMLLLVGAVAYGVRLEKKLTALREGQLAFAGAVTELNAAAGRAENALASLRASGEEADILHDRLMKARQVKTELEQLIARAGRAPAPAPAPVVEAAPVADRPRVTPQPAVLSAAPVARPAIDEDDARAQRMAALAERIQGLSPRTAAPAPGQGNVSAILSALTANQSAQQSLNRARANLDDDLFAA